MKLSRTLAASGFAIALGLGMTANVALAAPQPIQNSDHSSSMGQAAGDTWITTKVKSELATTKGVKSTDISVKTVDGRVTLTGVLPTHIAVKKAVAATKSVKGVKHVDASGLKVKG